MGSIRLHFILVTFCAAGCLIEGKVKTVKHCGLKGLLGGVRPQERIVGGEPAGWGDYPWMVTLQTNSSGLKHLCGATVINRHWLVTAAHCFKYSNKTSKFTISVGAHKLSSKFIFNGKKYKVKKIIIHENYNPQNLSNDIALIRTVKPFTINKDIGLVNGICLPPKDEEPTGTAIVTGWGHTQYNGTGTDVLHEVEVPLVSRGKCAKLYDKEMMPQSIICAGGINKDSCQSDSGGPLMQRNSKGRYTLIGIVSSGRGCGDAVPGQYTKVSAYLDWMDANMIGKRRKTKKTAKSQKKL